MLDRQRLGMLLILISASGGAFIPIFIRTVYEHAPGLRPTDMAVWRFLLSTPQIWIIAYLYQFKKPTQIQQPPMPISHLLLVGASFAGAVLSAMISLRYIAASLYVVLLYTYPAIIALISLFLGQRLGRRAWLAISMTLIGIIFTVPDYSSITDSSFFGVLMALGAAFMAALYFVLVGRLVQGTEMIRSSAWIFTGTLLALLCLVPFYGLQVPPNWQAWGGLWGISVIGTALPLIFLNIGIQAVGAPRASIIGTIEPVLAMVLAVPLLGETILMLQWLGALLIISAVIILEARPLRRTTPVTPDP